MANRLENSTSAYLRSAAHQPIDWHEFGEEAFELAKAQDKPVLLDIGAVWCHWCHVIDRESYENDEIAQLINQHYIAVKGDRDQRPDVDARYQQVVQSVSGQGGWPLTAFLTHDGRLIYGGTYFPPDAMKSLLNKIHTIYQERKEEIFQQGETLDEEAIRRMEEAEREQLGQQEPVETISPMTLKQLSQDFIDLVRTTAKRAYDERHGGFGSQPKFPHFSTLEFLIAQVHGNDGAHECLEMVERTLTEMARGGVYDQVAGGFHRYSVDDHWHVPHFEKMAYDNAEALQVYAQAHRLTGIPFFGEVARGIIGWVDELLCEPEHGGFFASQDADIDLNDDGDHFTWSPAELAEILTPEEQEVVKLYYDVHEVGDMHHAKGRNVLYVSRPLESVARELSLPYESTQTLLNSARAKMREKRRQRPMPFIDRTLYTNWNGMMIAAYLEAADLLDLPDTRDFAEKSLERILALHYQKGQTVYHTQAVEGFLDDYAWLARAAIKAYQSTAKPYYRDVAIDIAQMMLDRFEDKRMGGFFDTPQTGYALGLLKFKRKPVEDSPSSSANAVALQVLNALYYLTGEESYRTSLEKGLNLLIHTSGNYGMFVSALALVAMQYVEPPLKLEVLGRSHELQASARHSFFPGKLVSYQADAPTDEVRICLGTQCFAPVQDVETLCRELKTLCTATAASSSAG